jgi:NAD(P)-dependent dehydrogenase (short-subunit alcohol dehydrogenase family)
VAVPTTARTRAVVTGARGIGAAAAESLVRRGAQVFVIADDPGDCDALAVALGGSVTGWARADLREEAPTISAFDQAVESLGGLDAVVAVAGGSGRRFGDGPLHELTVEAWEATLALNLTTTFLTAREALRRFVEGRHGSLVLTSSTLARSPSPRHFGTHAYATAKAAIEGMVTALAAYYAPMGIRVNAVSPGLVRTAMAERAASDQSISAYVRRKQPIVGDLLDPRPLGEAMAWLALASEVTGQVLAVDGGWSVTEAAIAWSPAEETS